MASRRVRLSYAAVRKQRHRRPVVHHFAPLCTISGCTNRASDNPTKIYDGKLTVVRPRALELPTTALSMEEHTDDEPKTVFPCRIAQRWLAALMLLCLSLHTVVADANGPRRYFDLEAGDAPVMLNEFSRQSDLQVLFDFNLLRGMKTRAVAGDLDASVALESMLEGTGLNFDFVNDHTLAITAKKPSLLERMRHRAPPAPKKTAARDDL